jgi:hypothetical protein
MEEVSKAATIETENDDEKDWDALRRENIVYGANRYRLEAYATLGRRRGSRWVRGYVRHELGSSSSPAAPFPTLLDAHLFNSDAKNNRRLVLLPAR